MTSSKTRPMSAIALILALSAGPQISRGQQAAPAPVPAAPAVAAAAPVAGALTPDQTAVLRRALDMAPAQGFADKEFTPPELDGLLHASDPATRQRGEALLKAAVLRYASAVHRGRLAVSDFDDDWGMKPAAFDPAPGLQAALAANTVPQWLDGLPPAHFGYKNLIKALGDYRAIAARGGWHELPAGPALKQGMHDARVPALRARLAVEDPSVPAASAATPDLMDAPLANALKGFQTRHGLTGDGEMGKPTLAALNVPVGGRILQIMANMERWRWAPAQLPADRIQVNIAAAETTLFKGGQPVLEMRAAPGKPTNRTPMLQSQIRAVVFNPPWNIPDSIAKKEIYPKESAHPGYMEREDIHLVQTSGGSRLQQAAGPKSALGQVKFDFDNPYGVYLHDTPSRAAFERSGRMVSHGCVRLEKPRDLAAMLLDGQGDWDATKIDAKITAGETERVALARPIPVILFYWTAFIGADGAVNFRNDAYDWDHEILQKISEQKYSHA